MVWQESMDKKSEAICKDGGANDVAQRLITPLLLLIASDITSCSFYLSGFILSSPQFRQWSSSVCHEPGTKEPHRGQIAAKSGIRSSRWTFDITQTNQRSLQHRFLALLSMLQRFRSFTGGLYCLFLFIPGAHAHTHAHACACMYINVSEAPPSGQTGAG